VLDTNVIFSAVAYGGVPEKILEKVAKGEVVNVTSPILIEELFELVRKKTSLTISEIELLKEEFGKLFELVFPRETVLACRDPDDNRVLEAAMEGKCEYIVTGDKDLLDLKKYKKILILTPREYFEGRP
jgi:putative PIN family toxin of toxin-antitoxin system